MTSPSIARDPNERTRMTTAPRKKLIEVSLPLETINAESYRERAIPRRGHPSTLHLYWARRPLAAARAVLFAQLVDDPSGHPEEFPTIAEQDAERARLHALMEKLVVWENSNDESLMSEAREEIRKSNGGVLPPVLDPFSGGGTIPLEAKRLGLPAHANDLNPLSVLINQGLIGIPAVFAGQSPVFPDAKHTRTAWSHSEGLGEDVLRYGRWINEEAKRRIGYLYPKARSADGTEHTVIGWIWARTVVSPNPANPIEVPLARTWWLSKKKGKEAWIDARVVDGRVRYDVRRDPNGPSSDADGTIGRTGGRAVGDGTPFSLDYVRNEGRAGRIGCHLVAIVADGGRGRLYLSPNEAHIDAAAVQRPNDVPDGDLPKNPRDFKTPNYGLSTWSDLFTDRQLVTLTTLSELVKEVRLRIVEDAVAAGMQPDGSLEDGIVGAEAYADAVATYLALAVSKLTNFSSSGVSWHSGIEGIRDTFARQALPMVWDYCEVNVFSQSVGNFLSQVEMVQRVVESLPGGPTGHVTQGDAAQLSYAGMAISTDPPYYDNIGYSDLSDFFYVWLRRTLLEAQPSLVSTMQTPKAAELVANPYRHGGKQGAERFFIDGFNAVFSHIRDEANSDVPLTVYYAYKQQEVGADGASSTGWHTLLDGLIDAGWEITATWPLRSERGGRMISVGSNALASSIVLACRPRPTDAPATTRRAFVAALKTELPEALRTLMQGAIAPVDLAQAAIGPGVSVFSRYSRVREADGSDMSVKDALLLVNATLDEVIGEQESDFDPDTRFAVKWYRQYGWTQENSGIAEQLARSSDTSIGALERGGIFEAKGGKARLLSPTQLEDAWDVSTDERVSVWEATVRLAAVMAKHGADEVAALLPLVQTRVNLDAVKELGFLLFHEAEKKRDTKDAILFNGLVSAWGDVNEQARKHVGSPRAVQQAFDFDADGD